MRIIESEQTALRNSKLAMRNLPREEHREILEGGRFRGYEEDHKYGKYWRLRYNIFTKFDQIQFDNESLHSTKPERSCEEIARLFSAKIILDAFCGIGGVSIALARAGIRVIAGDIDANKVRMAIHNSGIYGCRDRICFHVSDAKDLIKSYVGEVDGLYIDPPWGGADYLNLTQFTFANFLFDGHEIKGQIKDKLDLEIALALPKNFRLQEIYELERSYSIHEHDSVGRNTFLTAFFPKCSPT